MRRWLLSTGLFLTIVAIQAQNVIFKVGGGLSTHYGKESVGAFKIGVGYEHEFNNNWSIEPGLLFYVKGWKDPNQTVLKRDIHGNIVYDDNGKALTSVKSCTNGANYIEIPVLFNYYWVMSDVNYLVFTAGPYVSLGVAGSVNTKGDTDKGGSEMFYYEKNTFSEEGVNRFDCGIQAGIAYQFNRQLSVGIEADFGLTNFNKGGSKNLTGLISLSYRFRLF